jgi:3-hydroxy acid dehydrogenase/malonic semialdehyde reductase
MKKILITGATSGIGEACATLFAREKYDLLLTGRRLDRLEKLAAQLKDEYHVAITILNFDVRNKDEVVDHLENLSAEWKQIDVQ